MKKKILAMTLAAALAAVAFTGCGSPGAGSPLAGGSAEAENTGVVIGMVPKLLNDDHLQAMGKGAKEACDELGYTLDFNGPANIDIAEQVEIVKQMTQKGYTAITLSSNDADALAPAMEDAAEAGILTSAWDSDIETDARACFMTQATAEKIGQALGEQTIAAGITEGKVLVINSTRTAPNQNAWLEACTDYLAENAPGIELVGNLPCDEDPAEAREIVYDYLMSHEDTVHVLSMCAAGLAGATEAIDQLEMADQVKCSGIFVPSLNRDGLKEGTVTSGVLWDPEEVGYCTIYMVKAQIEGTLQEAIAAGKLDCGRYGVKELADKDTNTFTVGDPLIFTLDNVDDYDF